MKKDLTIGFLTTRNPIDKKSWSGTINNIYMHLKEAENIEIIPLFISKSKVQKIILAVTKILTLKQMGLSKIADTFYKKNLIKMLHENPCDIYLCVAGSEILYLAQSYLNMKKVIYLSDTTYKSMIGYYNNDTKYDQGVRNQWEEVAIKNATKIVYSSDWAKSEALKHYNVLENKIEVIPFGPNMREVRYIEKNYNGKNRFRILLVGVDWKRKGIDVAIETVKTLNNMNKSYKFELLIVGVSKPKQKYPDYIRFFGMLNKNNETDMEKLIELYKKSDIFLLPTKAECAGIVFSEASMLGLPIYTYDTGGVSTYVENNMNGRCLPVETSGKKIAEIIFADILDGKMLEYSKNSRKKYTDELSWNRWFTSFMQIVDDIR